MFYKFKEVMMSDCGCNCVCDKIQKDILNTADSMSHVDVPEAVDILCKFIERISLDENTVKQYQSKAANILRCGLAAEK
jgi:3-methyladenine DNA glycosylase AlkD